MDLKKVISERRSVRRYLRKKVPEELINEVIDAARLAPSGNNAQPSRYVPIYDPKRLGILKEHDIIRDK
jgi:nitroreductase